MKYRNKSLTRIQKIMRKFPRTVQSICSLAGIKLEKNKPRQRQLKKARAKRYASMKKRLATQEPLKIDI